MYLYCKYFRFAALMLCLISPSLDCRLLLQQQWQQIDNSSAKDLRDIPHGENNLYSKFSGPCGWIDEKACIVFWGANKNYRSDVNPVLIIFFGNRHGTVTKELLNSHQWISVQYCINDEVKDDFFPQVSTSDHFHLQLDCMITSTEKC